MLLHTQWHALRQQALAAANNGRLQCILGLEVSGLDLQSPLVTGRPNPEALSAAQASVDRLRAAIMSCKVIKANHRVGRTVHHLLTFLTTACLEGLPFPSVESEAAWHLVKTTIACGLELLSISRREEALTLQTLSIRLHILKAAVQAWKAQLWLKSGNMCLSQSCQILTHSHLHS